MRLKFRSIGNTVTGFKLSSRRREEVGSQEEGFQKSFNQGLPPPPLPRIEPERCKKFREWKGQNLANMVLILDDFFCSYSCTSCVIFFKISKTLYAKTKFRKIFCSYSCTILCDIQYIKKLCRRRLNFEKYC
jgi:hypothetical protein